jgi:uncharacterized repeat protein (TIGR02543 family)
MRKKAWVFKDRTVLGILSVMLVFITLATGCPTGDDDDDPPAPPQTYTVTFNVDGGSAVEEQSVKEGGKLTQPSPAKTGYTFAGWYKDAAKTTQWNFATDVVTANTTLYANWRTVTPRSFTVTYDGNGSTGGTVPSDTHSYNAGALVTVLGNTGSLVKTGYTFASWTAANGSGTDYVADATFTISKSTTLYANWTPATVTYDGNGGAVEEQIVVQPDGTLTRPPDPTKAGHTFAGWYKDEATTTQWNFATDVVTENTTLYAKWILGTGYTVNFNTDGSAVEEQIVQPDGTLTRPPDPTKADYTFGGWYKDEATTTQWNFDTDVVTADTTLYAKWTPVTAGSFTVTYDSNGSTGGTVPSDTHSPYTAGTPVTVLGNTGSLVKTGYTFASWNTAANGSGTDYVADATFTISTNTTLYAKWIYGTAYTVTFNTDGGSPTPISQIVASGEELTRPADPTKGNHTFVGWYKDAATTTKWKFDTDVVTENTTLYAKWIYGTGYLGSFETGNGSAVEEQIVQPDGTLTRPPDPTRADYTFAGWYKDEATTTQWNFATDVVTENTTLYAKWIYGTAYTVTFNTDGGSPLPISQIVASGGTLTRPPDPTKGNHIFGGWYKEAAKTNQWNFATDVVTANTTLYAKWINPVTSISLNHVTTTLVPNDELIITPEILPANASNKALTWTSSDTSVATVNNNGVVTAVGPGTATITARAQDGGGTMATTQVTVHRNDIIIVFSGFVDEEIDLSHEGGLILSKSTYNNSLTVSLSDVENYSSIIWYVDGIPGSSGKSINVYPWNFSLGLHTVSAIVVKDSVPYSKTLTFQVTN